MFNIKISTMKKLINWKVWVNKDSKPIIMSLPFNSVNKVHEFLSEQIGTRISSISKSGWPSFNDEI